MLNTKHSVSPCSTIPLQGVRHMTSPALPTAAHPKEHLPHIPYHPVVRGEGEPCLTGTLRDIGPSARMLLMKHSSKNASRREKTKTTMSNTVGSRRVDKISSPKKGKGDDLEKHMEVNTAIAEINLGLSSMKGPNTDQTSSANTLKIPKEFASRVVEMSKTLNQTCTKNATVPVMNATLPKQIVPPIASALEEYVKRELRATSANVNGCCTAQDRLGPFREAFIAFIDSFPRYSNILNDILVAYDSVIQEQAGMLVSIITSQSEQQLNEEQMREEIFTLNHKVTALTDEITKLRTSTHGKGEEEEEDGGEGGGEKAGYSNHDIRQRTHHKRTSSAEKNKKIAAAREQINALSEINKSDLQKILVLINTVRESDRRAKVLEHDLSVVTAQVEELDDFKRMAGEAQTELEEFKLKFRNFVSVQDHELIKEQLTSELNAAHNTTRHYRRAVAVRGTQVDVIGRKLAQLQEDNLRLLDAVDTENCDILTPRPSWKKVYGALPDVKENADPIDALPLDCDEGATSSVEGLTSTALHVEYLVERVQTLSKELERRPLVLSDPPPLVLPLVAFGTDSKIPVHLRASGVIPRVKLDPIEMLIFVHDFFRDVLRPHPDLLLPTFDTQTLFLEFASDRIKTRENLNCFAFPEHLAMNILEEVKDLAHCRPSLVLLNGILSGVYPARLGCDAITVVENVRAELSALAAAQKKSRLRRTAISECISPALHLRSEKEIVALKEAMGSSSTHDVVALNSTTSRFMSLLLDQECASGMLFYVKILENLTTYSYFADQKGGGMVINLDNLGKAILEVEPLTPKTLIMEITNQSNDLQDDEENRIVHLNEVVRLLASAPIIRRRPLQKFEKGALW